MEGALIGEELCWGCSGIATSIVANILGALPVLLAGTDEQKRRWLAPLLEEPILCSFALTEPGAGSDVSGIQTTAVRHGDDYVLNGSKMFITNAGRAAWFTAFASTEKSAGHRGLTAFVVPGDAEGVTIEKHLDKMGQRADGHLGDRPAGREGARRQPAGRGGRRVQDRDADPRSRRGRGRPRARSGSRAPPSSTRVEYARERVTFGQPIAMNQGVNFLVADMAAEIEAARLLSGRRPGCSTRAGAARRRSSPRMAKRFAADTAMKVTTDAVQIFGGYGYIKEFPVEKLMRDAKLFQIYEGTSQIQRLVIATRVFLPRD